MSHVAALYAAPDTPSALTGPQVLARVAVGFPSPADNHRDLHYLLLSLLALMLLLAFVPQNPVGVAIFLTGVCSVLMTGVVAAGMTRQRRALALVFALPTVVCLEAYSLTRAPGLGLAARLRFLAFHVYITWSLLRTLLDHPTVQLNTLYGAACTYLLVGFAFATLYAALEDVHPPGAGDRSGLPRRCPAAAGRYRLL